MIRANGILMTWLLIHMAQTEAGGGEEWKEGRGSRVSGGGKAGVKRLLIKASHGQLDKYENQPWYRSRRVKVARICLETLKSRRLNEWISTAERCGRLKAQTHVRSSKKKKKKKKKEKKTPPLQRLPACLRPLILSLHRRSRRSGEKIL